MKKEIRCVSCGKKIKITKCFRENTQAKIIKVFKADLKKEKNEKQ